MAAIPVEIADYIRARIFVSRSLAGFLEEEFAAPGYTIEQLQMTMTGIPEDVYDEGTIEIGDQFMSFVWKSEASDQTGFDVIIRVTHLSTWDIAVQIRCDALHFNRVVSAKTNQRDWVIGKAKEHLTELQAALNS